MTSLAWVNLYICANILLALTMVLLAVIGALGPRRMGSIGYRRRLRIGHALVLAAMLLPFAAVFSDGSRDILPKTAHVWSAPTMKAIGTDRPNDERFAVAFAPVEASIPLRAAGRVGAGLFLFGLLVALIRVGLDIRTTIAVISQSQTVRRLGPRLSILTSERIGVPFSFWRPGRYYIVVPLRLVLHPADLKIAIRHEAQHHRQQDTKWLYFYQLLKALFFWNPAAHALERQLRTLQEFACDEALRGRRGVFAPDYCRCLLRIAEAAASQRLGLVRASMLNSGKTLLLKRRVEAVLLPPVNPLNRRTSPAAVVIGMTASALLVVTALAFGETIRDQRISVQQAAAMATLARANGGWPIAVNDRVVRQLNLLLATPDGRAYLQAGLDRMQTYSTLISAEIARRGLPAELSVVPLVESGYRNVPADGDSRHGAGLWMFIEPTARRFGLTVDSSRDERLDVTAQTRAAMEYFTSLYRRFGDWGLAILAYNAGTTKVEEGIRSTGSRDVWAIVREGHGNDPDYVSRVMAMALVMENPSVLD